MNAGKNFKSQYGGLKKIAQNIAILKSSNNQHICVGSKIGVDIFVDTIGMILTYFYSVDNGSDLGYIYPKKSKVKIFNNQLEIETSDTGEIFTLAYTDDDINDVRIVCGNFMITSLGEELFCSFTDDLGVLHQTTSLKTITLEDGVCSFSSQRNSYKMSVA